MTTANNEVRKVIREIVDRLLTDYAPQKIILFGSYAYGHPRPDSDIDLLIIKETSERLIDRWVTLRRILSDSTHRIPLETLVLTPEKISERLAVGDHFLAEIIEKGELLYAA